MTFNAQVELHLLVSGHFSYCPLKNFPISHFPLSTSVAAMRFKTCPLTKW